MKKIPTIFLRDPNNMSRVMDVPHPDCDWVFRGEGVATKKYDGTACLIVGPHESLYKRRAIKKAGVEPEGFILAEHDPNTGKRFGWVPAVRGEDKYHFEAFDALVVKAPGTYELIGPKVQGNPEGALGHGLIEHSSMLIFNNVPRTFTFLAKWLAREDRDIEGLVFHHPDGRMAKIKLRDFGLKRPSQ